MFEYSWLTLTEAACYLRTTESAFRLRVDNGDIPLSRLDGQLLFHRSQLDEYLFGQQVRRQERTGHAPAMPVIRGGGAAAAEPDKQEPGLPTDGFLAGACRLWDDGNAFLVKKGITGASCQFMGEPRLWVFPDKFQIPPKSKGNDLYDELRKLLVKNFPHMTHKATVHVASRSFSWVKFVEFVNLTKDLCRRPLHEDKESADLSIYRQCIQYWEEPPAFTIGPGIRGCSARYENRPKLWFLPRYLQIPAEGQGNSSFGEIMEIKERMFPHACTRRRVAFDDLGVDLDRLRVFLGEVKRLCMNHDAKSSGG